MKPLFATLSATNVGFSVWNSHIGNPGLTAFCAAASVLAICIFLDLLATEIRKQP